MTIDDQAIAGAPGRSGPRLAAVDALRGAALIAMFVYHFSWDLLFVGVSQVDVGGDPGWRFFAHCIASTFLGLVGFSLVLATRNGFKPSAYWRRFAKVFGAALLISLATYAAGILLSFGDVFIYFGILHSIAAASLLALLFLRLPSPVILIAAVLVILAPQALRSESFNAPYWWWLGLSTAIRSTVDYVPVLPWFAATLIGMVLGRLALAHERSLAILSWRPDSRLGRTLVTMGRWSLVIYLVHQPFLFGLANLVALVSR